MNRGPQQHGERRILATEPLGKSQDLGFLREFSPHRGLSPPKTGCGSGQAGCWASWTVHAVAACPMRQVTLEKDEIVLSPSHQPRFMHSWPGVAAVATLFHVEQSLGWHGRRAWGQWTNTHLLGTCPCARPRPSCLQTGRSEVPSEPHCLLSPRVCVGRARSWQQREQGPGQAHSTR